MDSRKAPWLKYLVTVVAGLVAAGLIIWNNAAWTLEKKDLLRILSDAFTVPGLLMLFGGLATWLSNEGAFDALSWLAVNVVKSFVPAWRDTREKYGDYVEQRRGKKASGFGYLLICGAAFVAVALLFLVWFKNV